MKNTSNFVGIDFGQHTTVLQYCKPTTKSTRSVKKSKHYICGVARTLMSPNLVLSIQVISRASTGVIGVQFTKQSINKIRSILLLASGIRVQYFPLTMWTWTQSIYSPIHWLIVARVLLDELLVAELEISRDTLLPFMLESSSDELTFVSWMHMTSYIRSSIFSPFLESEDSHDARQQWRA